MFDFDIGKMIVFGIVALAVIPPKDLPRVMRTVGNYVGKMRRMASDFQGQFMDAMKEVELESVKNELEALNKASKLDSAFDPVTAMRTEMTNAIEPPQAIGVSQPSLETSATDLGATAVTVTPLEIPDRVATTIEPTAVDVVTGNEAEVHMSAEAVSSASSPNS